MHHAVRLDLRQQGELRVEHGSAGKVDIVLALGRKDLGEPRRSIAMETRRAKIAQHRVVAGLVGLVEREQRRADQDIGRTVKGDRKVLYT